jgi:hypothetical protein
MKKITILRITIIIYPLAILVSSSGHMKYYTDMF